MTDVWQVSLEWGVPWETLCGLSPDEEEAMYAAIARINKRRKK